MSGKRHSEEIDAIITSERRHYLNALFAAYDMKWIAHWTNKGVRLRMRRGISFEADLGYAHIFLAMTKTEQRRMIKEKLPFI